MNCCAVYFVLLYLFLNALELEGRGDSKDKLYIVSSSVEDYDKRIEQRSVSSQRHEMLLGKDRELFSFSVDLKWLWLKAVDPKSWVHLIKKLFTVLNPFALRVESESEAKGISMEILSGIRKLSRSSVVKIFRGTLQQAQAYCILKNRFLVVYIEDVSTDRNQICRKTLADNTVGNAIIDQFILYAGSSRHAPTMKFAKSLGAKSFPYFAILHVPVSLKNDTLLKEIPEVLGTLNLGKDLRPDKVLRFFSKALEFHAKALVEDKKILDSNELQLRQTALSLFRDNSGNNDTNSKVREMPPLSDTKRSSISPTASTATISTTKAKPTSTGAGMSTAPGTADSIKQQKKGIAIMGPLEDKNSNVTKQPRKQQDLGS
jgi:hypothetical protein